MANCMVLVEGDDRNIKAESRLAESGRVESLGLEMVKR